ncbi:MAG TPA: coagulation factor 5/8 type domain-containing protein, partial [Thermoanaerobaculia bacterium]
QSYWTIAGAPADEEEILINEDGMIEMGGVGGFSIEPFVRVASTGELITWADAERRVSLARGTLPIPSVTWTHPWLEMTITALAGGEPGRSAARATYEIRNRSPRPLDGMLYVAMRPFQVNPPWQFLNVQGGFAEVASITWDGTAARVNRGRTLTPSPPPAQFGATRFDGGSIVDFIAKGTLPAPIAVEDPFRAASGAFAWTFALAPGERRVVQVDVPLHPGAPAAPSAADLEERWAGLLGDTRIDLPPAAGEIERTIDSILAYILVNQDGAAIQPGSRAYDRSWIRDGSLTASAMLRFGLTGPVRRFIEWYAPFQYPDGKVPCCVGKRGADPVPEHDSHGQLIFAIAEYVRHTKDLDFARAMWPHVAAAVRYIDTLRQQRMTTEYETAEKRAFFGLMPESISHEGYSAKPMHSYWDQLFGLKGLEDASWLARQIGADHDAIDAIRDSFRRDLAASIRLAMAMHDIDYIPGSVELGDFDATSTTIALEPVDARDVFPDEALERTFEKYWKNFTDRRDGHAAWENYTPYELRTVGSLLRLGHPDRAHEALAWFMGHRRPAAWNHWAEVVWNDPEAPKFIGDMPHTWVGSDFLRSIVDFFAYESNGDASLVIAAGIPEGWAREGVAVRNLHTHFGPLTYTIREEKGTLRLSVAEGTAIPPGGIVVQTPFSPRTVIRALPADVVLATRRTEVKR